MEINKVAKISVIICTYNAGKKLKKTLDSLLHQSIDHYEIVIIDGVSDDDTVEIIADYEKEFGDKLRWKSESDNGIYHAMNKGVAMANGEYLNVVGAGDWLEVDALKEALLCIAKYPHADAVHGKLRIWDEHLHKNYLLQSFPHMLLTDPMQHPALYYKKSLHKTYGLYDESYVIVSDYLFCMKAFLVGTAEAIAFDYIVNNYVLDGISAINASQCEEESIRARSELHLLPLVSIIVPAYNQALYIEETLNSIVAQVYPHWECIIIDDGSTDGTFDIVNAFVQKDTRFKYIKQQNSGPSSARNNGILQSHGTYVLPLDSDDLISMRYIYEAIEAFLKNPKRKIVYCKAEFIGERRGEWNMQAYSYDDILFSNSIFCSAMYRRSDYDQTQGYNINMKEGFEDWDFWLSLIQKDDIVYRIPRIHFYYRIKKISRTTTFSDKKNLEKQLYKQLFINHKEKYEEFFNPIYQERQIRSLHQQVDVQDRKIKQKDQALKQKDQALKQKDQVIAYRDGQIDEMEVSKFWRARNIYMHYKVGIIAGIKDPSLLTIFAKKRFRKLFGRSINIQTSNDEKEKIIAMYENKLQHFYNKNLEECLTNKKISIIIPIYNAYKETKDCISSVIDNTQKGSYELILINDQSTDERVEKLLSEYKGKAYIMVLHNTKNLGFVRTVNRGFKETNNDVVILNSDTKVTDKWLLKMTIAAYQHDKIGTVTPFSNAAGAFSVPEIGVNDDLPLALSLYDMGKIVEYSSYYIYPEVPTGNGFCMYIKRDLIADIGVFDAERFGRGYGEENDFCMRAEAKGWKNIIDDSTFIYHKRSASFSNQDKQALIQKNRKTLDQLHPTYGEDVKKFLESSQIKKIRSYILKKRDFFLNSYGSHNRKRILYILHAGGGGVPQTNADLMKHIEKSDYDVFVLTSDTKAFRLYTFVNAKEYLIKEWSLQLIWDVKNFSVLEYRAIYFDILFGLKIDIIHIRHLFKHSFDIVDLAKIFNIRTVLSFHDCYFICPSFHLLTETGKFCEANCNMCKEKCRIPTDFVKIDGRLQDWTMNIWRGKIRDLFSKIDTFVTTSHFTKNLYTKTYPMLKDLDFFVIEHGRDLETDRELYTSTYPEGKMRILVPGNTDFHKGSQFIVDLLKCDKDNKFEFHFIGMIDDRLRAQKNIHYHGSYKRENFHKLVQEIKPHFIGVLSIAPETYSHTLTEAWHAGVPVLVTDIGALQERVNDHGGGVILDRMDPQRAYTTISGLLDDEITYKDLCDEVHVMKFRSSFTMSLEYLKLYKILIYRNKDVCTICIFTNHHENSYPPSTYIRILSPILNNDIITKNAVILLNPEIDDIIQEEDVRSSKFVVIQRDGISIDVLQKIEAMKDERHYQIIFEIDDDILSICDLHPEFEKYESKKELISSIAMIANTSIATNDVVLRSLPKNSNRRDLVVQNYIDERLWSFDQRRKHKKNGHIVIGYIGSFTHDSDLEMISPVIRELKTELYSEKGLEIEFKIVGGSTINVRDATVQEIPHSSREYPAFAKWCASNVEIDIGIAPLDLSNKLNHAKSGLKYLEYTALGIPGIYTDIPAYANIIQNGHNGFLIEKNDRKLWKQTLKKMILDEVLRQGIAHKAYQDVRCHYLLRDHKNEWAKIFSGSEK